MVQLRIRVQLVPTYMLSLSPVAVVVDATKEVVEAEAVWFKKHLP
jgi:hypothetical protein